MWTCDSCQNVNADDAAYCYQCGDLGPIGEKLRLKAARRPGEQLIWMLAVAGMLIWPLAVGLPLLIHRARLITTVHGQPQRDPFEAFYLNIAIVLIAGAAIVGLGYLIGAGIWIYKRRRAHKALVDTEE